MFSAVGAIGTAGHYAMLIGLVELGGISPLLATTCGFAVGALINYYLKHHYTFKSKQPYRSTALKFMTIACFTAVVNGALMQLGTLWLGLNYLLVQVVATVVVVGLNFLANKYWTFVSKN